MILGISTDNHIKFTLNLIIGMVDLRGIKIAVYFGGTIVEHEYPAIGKEKLFAFQTARLDFNNKNLNNRCNLKVKKRRSFGGASFFPSPRR